MRIPAAHPVRLFCCAALVCCAWAANPTGVHSAEPIKIGAVLPFSGGVELYGRQAKLGLDLAAKDINAGGGILGRPVDVIYEDDKTDPAAAVDAITSRNLIAIAPVVEAAKTPLLYATNYEGGQCSRYIFSFSTVPNQELAQLLPYMNRTFGKTYFLLGADRAWPHKMFEAAEPIIAKLGGRVVGKAFTTGKETDFAPLIARVAASKAKVLLFALKGDGLNFIPQADDLGLLKHTAVALPFVATNSAPASKAFTDRVKAQAGAGTSVSNYVMTHYNALIAMKAALEKVGKVDKEAMIDGLEGLEIKSPTGRMSIGKNHHAAMTLFLAKTKGRELVTVRTLGEIAPEPGCK
jgi:urea transport system substrate-binding protein